MGMNQFESRDGSVSHSLDELLRKPLEIRCSTVLDYGKDQIESVTAAMTNPKARRLAWAIAFNVEGPVASPVERETRKGKWCYCDRWPVETRWSEVWSYFTK